MPNIRGIHHSYRQKSISSPPQLFFHLPLLPPNLAMSRVFLFYIFLFSIFLAIQSEQAVQSDSSPSAPAAAETKDDDGILLTSIKELSFYYNRYVRSAHEEYRQHSSLRSFS